MKKHNALTRIATSLIKKQERKSSSVGETYQIISKWYLTLKREFSILKMNT